MFQRLHERTAADRGSDAGAIAIEIDGAPHAARPGDTVAAALLLAGGVPMRTSAVSGAPRSAYCMMGVCFECLVEIDGVPSQQGCLIEVRPGMRIRRQHGRPQIG